MVSVPVRRRVCAAATLLVLAVAPVATAATKNGITPLRPLAGAKAVAGRPATFRMRVKGKGKVFVHVCKSAKRSAKDGTICAKVTIGQAKKLENACKPGTKCKPGESVARYGVYSYTQRFYDFPAFWLNTPGTYYWQSYRIACEHGSVSDCRQESPVVKFRVA